MSGLMLVLFCAALCMVPPAGQPSGRYRPAELPAPNGLDDRPPIITAHHNLSDLWSMFQNTGMYGDIWIGPTMEWPGGEGSGYLYFGGPWASAYGEVTPSAEEGAYVSCFYASQPIERELMPSEGHPLVQQSPGPVALEETRWAEDDWCPEANSRPMGVMLTQRAYSWSTPGYDQFLVNDITVTHHSSHGNPGVPLDAFCLSICGDCDPASADRDPDYWFDDLVFYDGHAIWCNDPDATFDYMFDDGTRASRSDRYVYRQNRDASYASPEDDIFYFYNYRGADGIVDADVNSDGVSDHFTVLFRVSGEDTVYTEEENTGLELFADGRPGSWWEHTVGDTVYAVVPRSMSYMWDGDDPESSADDSGEWDVSPPCNGFIGWRLLDCWVRRADGTLERPVDVLGCPIPLSHSWWISTIAPASTDDIKYDYAWGENQDGSGRYSGPAYLADWMGDPSAPNAFQPDNPGPFPIVHANPLSLDYGVYDYRFLQTMGPVDLADGDSLHVVGAWMVARGLEGLRLQADVLLDAYYRGGGWGVPDIPPSPVLFYEAGDDCVELVWADNAESYEPFGGYRLYRSVFDSDNWQLVEEFEPGSSYYMDESASNGYPYYYALCSFDAETGVESARINYKQDADGNPIPVVPSWATSPDWTSSVSVVPNPYRGSAEWELPHESRLAFINLPAFCDIHIYTLSGDHVRTLQHRDAGGSSGTEYWDLQNWSGRSVATGLYVYCVETEDDRAIGKFAVLR